VAKTISFFNNKGGVSKTTTCFNVGWMLADRGHSVVMVDADPQCNLTGMVLDLSAEGALDRFYVENPKRNLRDARPRPLEPVDCVDVEGRPNLRLIPGHVGLAEDEISLGIAQQLSESVQALKNLPGSISHLLAITAASYEADYVLVDLSPGLGSINQNLVATADFVAVPASPDVFSVMAIDSLARVLPRWISWARSAADLPAIATADYPFPSPHLKFLGMIVQRYRLKSKAPTERFRMYFDQLDEAIEKTLVPALTKADLLLPADRYEAAHLEGSLRLASIPDFNSLIAVSQQSQMPVFKLTQDELQRTGTVLDSQLESVEKFREIFDQLAQRIEILTAD
jgi:cellulose biosynthesis protein BcsQ